MLLNTTLFLKDIQSDSYILMVLVFGVNTKLDLQKPFSNKDGPLQPSQILFPKNSAINLKFRLFISERPIMINTILFTSFLFLLGFCGPLLCPVTPRYIDQCLITRAGQLQLDQTLSSHLTLEKLIVSGFHDLTILYEVYFLVFGLLT